MDISIEHSPIISPCENMVHYISWFILVIKLTTVIFYLSWLISGEKI